MFFAAATQLLISAVTRSMKEAQTYLGLLPLVPGLAGMVLALAPVNARPLLAAIPTFGQTLLMGQVVRGEAVALGFIGITTIATLIATALLLYLGFPAVRAGGDPVPAVIVGSAAARATRRMADAGFDPARLQRQLAPGPGAGDRQHAERGQREYRHVPLLGRSLARQQHQVDSTASSTVFPARRRRRIAVAHQPYGGDSGEHQVVEQRQRRRDHRRRGQHRGAGRQRQAGTPRRHDQPGGSRVATACKA